jgi:DNA integrity scanning protein DisA with diadenylate cyclase activity
MSVPAYPVAQEAARSIHAQFARHLAAPGRSHQEVALLPEGEVMATIIDAAFWASLRREEGFVPRISLAFLPPESSANPLLFARPFPLAPEALTRLAPAVERAGIHLGVWGAPEALFVWGTTRNLPPYCFVLEAVSPGVLVLKHSPGEDSGKFSNVAVLAGDKIKILAQHSGFQCDCPARVNSLLEAGSTAKPGSAENVLLELAVSMRAHGRGGALMVVPDPSTQWRDSIRAVSYPVEPHFDELTELMRNSSSERAKSQWQKRLRRSIDAIAGLTAVDGATVITQDYRVLAFGAKIKRRGGCSQIEKVLLSEPVEDSAAEIIDPAQLGGTRHLSAAQFAQDQRDAFALVASQDGQFTSLAWSSRDGMVHAHRIETLLM